MTKLTKIDKKYNLIECKMKMKIELNNDNENKDYKSI